jgi:hypothetical protein
VPRHKSPCVREGAGRDGDVGGDTSGPAPPPRGNRAGADEAGLLARGAVASLPGALTPVAGGAAADHGRLRVGSSYSGGAAPVSHRTSGWPRLPWIDCVLRAQFIRAARPAQACWTHPSPSGTFGAPCFASDQTERHHVRSALRSSRLPLLLRAPPGCSLAHCPGTRGGRGPCPRSQRRSGASDYAPFSPATVSGPT